MLISHLEIIQGTGTITNDETANISIGDVTVSESDAGESNSVATLTIEIDRVAQEDITVQYDTDDGTATTIDSDYVEQTGIATIFAGQTSTTIDVSIVGDDLVESDENLTVELKNFQFADAAGGTSSGNQVAIERDTGVVTIIDNDEALVSVIGNDAAAEADDDGQFTVRLSSPASTDTTIAYTLSGDAVAGEDFAPVDGEVTILAGDSFRDRRYPRSGRRYARTNRNAYDDTWRDHVG